MKHDEDHCDASDKIQDQHNLLVLLRPEFEEKLKSDSVSLEDFDFSIEELRAISRAIH